MGVSTFLGASLLHLHQNHSGSPWGAGVIANGKATREPSELELTIAHKQGKAFYNLVSKVAFDQWPKETM